MTTLDDMLDDILRREGGFVNDADDLGGATNFGITIATLAAYRGTDASVEDVRNLSRNEARAIYEKQYLKGPKLDRLPSALQPFLFDSAVNHGPGSAVKFLQRALNKHFESGLEIDGGNGPKTRAATEAAFAQAGDLLIPAMVSERLNHYINWVNEKPSQKKFLLGWMRRLAEFT
jgi:lysozyme family protein